MKFFNNRHNLSRFPFGSNLPIIDRNIIPYCVWLDSAKKLQVDCSAILLKNTGENGGDKKVIILPLLSDSFRKVFPITPFKLSK